MKKVVLTGVSRGLGRAMARKIAALGHLVLGCSRTECHLLQAPHEMVVLDVADGPAVQRWAANLVARHGPPDLVLNNAALINRNAPLWEVPHDEFTAVVDVNIKGVYFVVHAFLPSMIEAGRGVFVNFSSGWGRSASPEVAPYCATKWAIEGLTKALAHELPEGLAAVSLNPGIINTEMLQSCFGESAHGYGTPDQWAEQAVPFLLGLGPKDNGRALTAPG